VQVAQMRPAGVAVAAAGPGPGDGAACGQARFAAELVSYCTDAVCEEIPAAPLPEESGRVAFPDLAAAAWTHAELPTTMRLRLRDGSDPAGQPVEAMLGIDGTMEEAVVALLSFGTMHSAVPLTVEMKSTQYRVGRSLQVFSDAECTVEVPRTSMDLSNPGNNAPGVPACSYFRIFEDGNARSKCMPIEFDLVEEVALARLPQEACGAKRVVVMVDESSSLNGRAGQEIETGIRALARRIQAAPECLQVDLMTSVGSDTRVTALAEDLYFDPRDAGGLETLRMDFVSANSEVLRGFEWIYRRWGDDLAGVIFVGDGTNLTIVDMIEAPAAMAWRLKNVATGAILFGGDGSCETFDEKLLFQECHLAKAGEFGTQLDDLVTTSIAAIDNE